MAVAFLLPVNGWGFPLPPTPTEKCDGKCHPGGHDPRFTGSYEGNKGKGELVEMFGFGVATVDDQLRRGEVHSKGSRSRNSEWWVVHLNKNYRRKPMH